MAIKVNEDILLTKRKNTAKWQASIKDPKGVWRRVSCKTDDEEQAKQFAYAKLAEWRVLHDRGIDTVSTHTFKFIAEKYKEKLALAVDSDRATKSQQSYKGIIDNYLIPFFGNKSCTNIDGKALEEFDEFRFKKLGREPAKGTINKHHVALRAVIENAVNQKWMKASDMPRLTIKGKGRRSEPRGYFEPDEFNQLMKYMVNYRKQSKTYITKYKRDVLRIYVYFLTVSGVRPGEEALNIRWSDIDYVETEEGKKDYYRVQITAGKKANQHQRDIKIASRQVIISVDSYLFLEPLKEIRKTDVKDDDLVFCMPDGSPVTGLSEMFRNCLTDCGLRYASNGASRSLYSCRHTYATWKLQHGELSYEQLKRQMGTSIMMLEHHYDHATGHKFADDLMV